MKKILFVIAIALLTAGCRTVSTYYETEPRCMGIDANGQQRIMAFGKGRNSVDARYQAKKNAVSAVIFDGVRAGEGVGQGGCDPKPLITEQNAREKYDVFFAKFFGPKGDYYKFVTYKKTRNASAVRSRSQHEYKIGLVLVVDRIGLKAYLKENGIIK